MNERMKQQVIILCMGMVLLLLLLKVNIKPAVQTDTAKETKKNITEYAQRETEKKGESGKKPEAENPLIRVMICSDQYQEKFHDKIVLECSSSYLVQYDGMEEEHSPQEVISIEPGDPWLQKGAVNLIPLEKDAVFTIPALQRNYENPKYSGSFSVEQREDGLLLVNELPLETYLCSVVPSEMPSSYPLEALKAQAVCARTYARQQMEGNRCDEYGADLDDSVSYQVYNNIAKQESTTKAVQETAGITMEQNGKLVDAYYYSTSCGISLSDNLSQEAVFCAFMGNDSAQAYEKEEPWYRWKAFYSLQELSRLADLQTAGIGEVTGMEVASRENSGSVKTMILTGTTGTLQMDGEYDVRRLLQTDDAGVTLQDGSAAPDLGMLPSAFFYLTPLYEGDSLSGYQLTGGGYGHGNGMSQNGAKHMAQDGKSWKEILKYYYGEIQTKQ